MRFKSREIDGFRIILLREMTNIIKIQNARLIENVNYHSKLLSDNYKVDVHNLIRFSNSPYAVWELL